MVVGKGAQTKRSKC